MDKMYFVIRYGIVGVAGAITQLFFDWLFIEIFDLWYMYGVIVGFLAALAITFTLHRYWTFRVAHAPGADRQFLLYTGTALFSLVGNIGLMYYFVDVLSLWYVSAQIITVAIVAGLSFLFNTFITFQIRTQTETNV